MRNKTGLKRAAAWLLAALLLIAVSRILTGCGAKTMQIKVTDRDANTFVLVDGSGAEIEYDKLMLDGKEVVDHYCSSVQGLDSVAFATGEGQIVRDGSSVTLSGCQSYTAAAELTYELSDGVLTITGTK